MNTKKRWAFDCLILIWSVTFLASVAYAEPKDLPKEEPKVEKEAPAETPRIVEMGKPITCTTDPYDVVKQNFQDSHKEVGFMRWVSDRQTAVEVIGNPSKGTVTILEFVPQNGLTCFISIGTGLEVNSLIFEQVRPQGGFLQTLF
jgi:hypothetical protein